MARSYDENNVKNNETRFYSFYHFLSVPGRKENTTARPSPVPIQHFPNRESFSPIPQRGLEIPNLGKKSPTWEHWGSPSARNRLLVCDCLHFEHRFHSYFYLEMKYFKYVLT